MPDYRKMYDDKEHLYAFDLDGIGDRTLEIVSVSRGELTGENNRKSKKPIVTFAGESKKLALNKTNGKTIAALYGKDTDRWVGELITIYPTTTEFGGKTVDCIRVRPERPERSEARRQAPDRASGKPGSRQSKAERDAAESSAVTARYLVGEYEKCDGSVGFGDDKMAELKVARGRAWPTLFEGDRNAVAAAAVAAKTRIDASAQKSGTMTETPPGDAASAAAPDADEAAEIARSDREAAARG